MKRFWDKVEKTDTCWLWTAGKQSAGYGAFSLDGRHHLAHRVAYELAVGEIPAGLVLDHLCRVRHCVNPAHLEPVTHRVNILRGEGFVADQARRETCPQGHPYDYRHPSGSRRCRRCAAEYQARRREAAR